MKLQWKQKAWALLVVPALAIGLFSGCTAADSGGSQASTAVSAAETVTPGNMSYEPGTADTDTGWDDSATMITLSGTDIAVDGGGASAKDGVVTITSPGVYVVSGILEDGQIVVDAAKTDQVRVVFNGVTITNKTGAPFYGAAADDITVTLAEGTENILTDGGADFAYADTVNEEPDAALFAKCDLTFNGTGSLTVSAGFNNGIGTKDDLVILGGTYTVDAANHGIRGRDSLTVVDGAFHITAGNDGLQSNNDEDPAKGWISLEGGSYTITSVHDGIQAETSLQISGGTFAVTAGGGANGTVALSDEDTSDSFKGIKAGTELTVSSGTIHVDSADDSVHANGNVTVSGGVLTLASGDDGIHSDETLTITDGTVTVTTSYEGIEGANVLISGGVIDLVASDDGINAAGGSSAGTDGGRGNRFGPDSFGGGGDYSIRISGGTVSLRAGGDGLDSNGSITVSGGEVITLIQSSPDNEAVDCDGTYTVTGGTVIAGGSGAGKGPGTDSAQSYVYLESGAKSGQLVTVKKDDQTLLTFTPDMDCQYLSFSTADMVSGEAYTVDVAGTATEVTAGTGGGMGMGRGGMGGRGGTPSDGAMPGGFTGGQRPEGMDMETMQKAMEIIRQADSGTLTEAQKSELAALGLSEEEIERMLTMPQRGDAPQPPVQGE